MSLMFIPRTWNKTPGILNSPNHSLQKPCLPKCVLNMYKHMLCILRGSCQNPAGASSTETIWLQKQAPIFFSFQVMEILPFYIFSSFKDQKFIKCTSNLTSVTPNMILSMASLSNIFSKPLFKGKSIFHVAENRIKVGHFHPYSLLC